MILTLKYKVLQGITTNVCVCFYLFDCQVSKKCPFFFFFFFRYLDKFRYIETLGNIVQLETLLKLRNENLLLDILWAEIY